MLALAANRSAVGSTAIAGFITGPPRGRVACTGPTGVLLLHRSSRHLHCELREPVERHDDPPPLSPGRLAEHHERLAVLRHVEAVPLIPRRVEHVRAAEQR